MFKDKKLVYVVEYIVGFSLLIIVLPFILNPKPGWSSAHWWAYLLFMVSSGFIFISCASEMKQRMELSERISKLEEKFAESRGSQSQAQSQSNQKRPAGQQLVGSVN